MAIQDCLQKLSDMRKDFVWRTTQHERSSSTDGSTNIDPLLKEMNVVFIQARSQLADSKVFLDTDLYSTIRDDLRKLWIMQIEYKQSAALPGTKDSIDEDPLLLDLHFTSEEANKALADFKSFLLRVS
ncbi:unnamed protein product [Dibothriocephalus latus]|uniref:Uncharacterized protein n=1 Tax=Dibothriocephalus latus TaxID=60516 RepID=A0A3P7L8F9_DIBLA|nr:unnamed protein product [Dibothriocephalus latus]